MDNDRHLSEVLLSRRAALRWAGLGAVSAVGLAGCNIKSRSNAATASTTLPTGGAPFSQPEELVSAGGRLDVTLDAAPWMVPWNGGSRYALAYNGSVPGPTLRVRPGDRLVVTLRNGLDTPTNLHTHGLHVSPSGTSDNIFLMVEPGASQRYEYHLPADHPSGTFWYHPHHHGFVAAQVSGGLAGAIIVEDELDDLPAMKATTERVLVISDPKIGADASVLAVTSSVQQDGREGDAPLINGVLRPVIGATVGTEERWRIVNASASRYYRLRVSSGTMVLIGSDHGRLDAPLTVDSLLITPGQRAEVLVPLTAVGTVTLSSEAVARGMTMGGGMGGMGSGGALSSAADLLSVRVTSPTNPTTATAAAPVLPSTLRPLVSLDEMPATSERHVSFGAMSMGNGEFVIDGKPFAGDRVDIQARLNTVEEWIITNNSMMPHPFHLHVWPFRVVSRSDGSAPDPGWRDTVNVPTGHSVRIRVPFRDFAGKAVYHCHILDHEDLGMMGIIDVQ